MNTNCIRYLIVGCKRSGTTVLDQAISEHPEVSSISDEIRIEPLFSQGLSTYTFNHEPATERLKGWRAIFDAIAGINRADETRAIGFKVAVGRPQQASWLVQNAHKVDPDLRIIFVHRDDLAAQYGSLLRAKQSGVWHSWGKDQKMKNQQIEPDLSAFSRYAVDCLAINDQLRLLKENLPFIEISYENDIALQLDVCVDRLFRFIGVSPSPATWITSRKVAPAPGDYIKKYTEMTAELTRVRNGGSTRPWSLSMHLRFIKSRLAEASRQFSRLAKVGPLTE